MLTLEMNNKQDKRSLCATCLCSAFFYFHQENSSKLLRAAPE